jgi:hypothetical protein
MASTPLYGAFSPTSDAVLSLRRSVRSPEIVDFGSHPHKQHSAAGKGTPARCRIQISRSGART